MSKSMADPVPGVDIPPRPGQRIGGRFWSVIHTIRMRDVIGRRDAAPGEVVFAAASFGLSLLLLLPWQTG